MFYVINACVNVFVVTNVTALHQSCNRLIARTPLWRRERGAANEAVIRARGRGNFALRALGRGGHTCSAPPVSEQPPTMNEA